MNHKINFHTHSTFCDGQNTAEDMIISAIEKGFTILGFSSHSLHPLTSDFYTANDRDWHMPQNRFNDYLSEIKRLKEKYQDKIQIFTGFEADYFEDQKIGSAIPDMKFYDKYNPDYLIGSVHFIGTPKGFYTVDHSTEVVKQSLDELYKDDITGIVDYKKAVCEYFEAERQMLQKGSFHVLGHADLIRKRNGDLHFFNENESWYKEQIELTVNEIARTQAVVELNTGALARGIKDTLYPSAYMLELLNKKGVPVCVNSDCHNAPLLDFAYDYAYDCARKAGYKELVYPTKNQNFIVKL